MEPDDLNKPVTREEELDRVTREFREWQVRHKAALAALDRISPPHDVYGYWISGEFQLCDFDHDYRDLVPAAVVALNKLLESDKKAEFAAEADAGLAAFLGPSRWDV